MSGLASSITAAQAGAVALGAAVGALLRWWAGLAFNHLWAGFPLGTLLVNAVGGLLIGVAMVWFARSPHELLRLLLVTGLLGGFTTFSSFSAESLGLLQRGDFGLALLHSAAHLLGALACCAVGVALARWLLH
ncbi:fluoride efflux transporter CrcB [Pseudaquabacterium pictum]|uniref:Fluoride-specific ion channel FluC n=1 Tax=Pseudaquabacterium pictum TaxID=2315236 RepID=A0A480ARF3_9BURK|nr:fluoride efflux transporter CrcB [Rubrivivax pictus]GCL63420.1 putative fluoride ion transporter CrcB [Rubrivivax pictus]